MASGHTTGQRQAIKNKRKETLLGVQQFLADRKIKSEIVMDFVCFTYKEKDYRVTDLMSAKKVLGLFM